MVGHRCGRAIRPAPDAVGRGGESLAYWDQVAPRYDALYQTQWSLAENRRLAKHLNELMRPGATVLDIGCGTGLGYSLLSSNENYEYHGIDPSPAMLELCARKCPSAMLVPGVASDLRAYADEQFDLVIAVFNVMSYEERIGAALDEIRRVLRRGGVGYLSFLNRSALRRLTRGAIGRWEVYGTRGAAPINAPVCRTYTRRELRRAFDAAGLKAQQICTTSVLAGVAETRWFIPLDALLTRVVPWLGHTNDVICRKEDLTVNA
jgi:ubiquinone/menaquinone biosynthesis C-methylase UbiE